MKRVLRCLLIVGVLLAGPDVTVSGCGINFSLPKFHFPHVNDRGKLSYWEKVGEIDFGDGLILPVNLNFSADRYSISPTLNARGFLLGLTDASAVQLDERKFRVYTPAGRYRTFRRDKKNPNVLHSGKNWKGEFKGDILSVASECGDRLTYHKGTITQMQLKGRTFDFVRSGGRVTEIREGGRTIVKVTADSLGGDVELSYGTGKKINFQFSQRPVVQVVGGQRVIGVKERTLRRVTGENNFVREFEFAVDSKAMPILKVNNEELIWNATSGFVLSDGLWKYDIKPGETELDNAIIARTNFKGESEFWHRNRKRGEEIVIGVDGTKEVSTWFTSGKLRGAIRKREEVLKGVKKMTYHASYDESGNLFRELLEDGQINQFAYNEKGQKVSKTRLVDGEPSYTVKYIDGRISTVESKNGRTRQYYYNSQGQEVQMTINGRLHSKKSYADDGSWTKEVVFDDAETPTRTFYREFDSDGKVRFDRITEHVGSYPEITKRYFYDIHGRLERTIDSQQGAILHLTGDGIQRSIDTLKLN